MAREDSTARIDEALEINSHQHTPDDTGLNDTVELMVAAKQAMDAARIAGFSEAEAFQIARDLLMETFRMTFRAAQ